VAGYTWSFGAGWSDVYLIKTNSTGDTLWTRTYGGSSWDEGYSVQQTTDGGYILAGWTSSFGAGGWDAYLIKTDSLGDTLWSRTYGGSYEDRGTQVQQTTDGGYIVSALTYSFGAGNSDVMLTKFDSLGNSCIGEFVSSTVMSVSFTVTSPATEVTSPATIVASPPTEVTSPATEVHIVCTTQPPSVISTSPTQNELNVSVSSNISVTFDIDMDETTINDSTFVVNAWSTGLHQGTITYNSLTKTATLDPDSDFAVGEIVTVVLTRDIESAEGVPLDSSYVWSFTSAVDNGYAAFSPPVNYGAGDRPISVFCADLDGDGDLDLALANDLSDNVSILKNKGDGTFQAEVNYSAGRYPGSVYCADLDGDSDLDLAVANYLSDNVSILKNNGDGAFLAKVDYVAGDGPFSLFCADLDGDGDLDLAVENTESYNVSILKNNGDGTFQTKVDYPAGQKPWSVFCADLDGDSDLDLAVANGGVSPSYDSSVSILKNNGDGTFQAKVDYPAGLEPASVFCADLDGDTDLDLAVANCLGRSVSILKNNGDGTFQPKVDYPVGSPTSVFCADLDGDGDLDLAVAGAVCILKNNGDGSFQSAVTYGAGDGPWSVFCADLDGEGDLDLAVANEWSNNVSILFNCLPTGDCNGDDVIDLGDVLHLINYLYKGGPAPDPFGAGDVNCDEVIDLGDVLHLINYLYKGGPPPGCC